MGNVVLVHRSGRLKKVASGAFTALILLGVAGVFGFLHFFPELHAVNATGQGGVSFFVDGSPFAQGVPHAANEGLAGGAKKHVFAGTHTVEARNAAGKVLDKRTVVIAAGTDGYLYAPRRTPSICYGVQTVGYGSMASASGGRKLEGPDNFWPIKSVNWWFQAPPSTIKVKNASGAVRYAVRQFDCPAPAAAQPAPVARPPVVARPSVTVTPGVRAGAVKVAPVAKALPAGRPTAPTRPATPR